MKNQARLKQTDSSCRVRGSGTVCLGHFVASSGMERIVRSARQSGQTLRLPRHQLNGADANCRVVNCPRAFQSAKSPQRRREADNRVLAACRSCDGGNAEHRENPAACHCRRIPTRCFGTKCLLKVPRKKKARSQLQAFSFQAERGGFEPPDPISGITSLAMMRIRPLCHLSGWFLHDATSQLVVESGRRMVIGRGSETSSARTPESRSEQQAQPLKKHLEHSGQRCISMQAAGTLLRKPSSRWSSSECESHPKNRRTLRLHPRVEPGPTFHRMCPAAAIPLPAAETRGRIFPKVPELPLSDGVCP